MKKSLLAVVAALAMVGCTQNDMDGIDNGRQDSKTAINFNSVVMKNAKAVATTTSSFTEFTVNAYSSSSDFAGTAKFFFTDVITKSGDVWAGTKTIYWPATDNVNFFAYAPADAATYDPATNTDLTNYPTLAYTVPEVSAQKDLVAAVAINQKKTESAVNLVFKHLLTQVNFSIIAPIADLKYTVTKIELSSVANQGTFTYDGTATAGAWSGQTGTETYAYNFTSEAFKATSAGAEKALGTGSNALMLLPQDNTAKITLSVTYKVEQGSTEILASTTKTAEITPNWAPGKNVLYKITLPTTGLNTIKVTGTMTDAWEAATETPEIK